MNINVSGIHEDHEAAINKGFAPWNLHSKFKHKYGDVVTFAGVEYLGGGVTIVRFEVIDKSFAVEISCDFNINDYEMIEKVEK